MHTARVSTRQSLQRTLLKVSAGRLVILRTPAHPRPPPQVLVMTVVATLGALQLLPAWLAVLVVARDSSQIVVTVGYRFAMFGGRWPGYAAFFEIDDSAGATKGAGGGGGSDNGAANTDVEAPADAEGGAKGQPQQRGDLQQRDAHQQQHDAPGHQPQAEMPRMRPLLVSKVNTALAFGLIGGVVLHQWQGVPPAEVLRGLELAVGATTLASGLAYFWLHRRGRLLQ
jgi:hypothetical protein